MVRRILTALLCGVGRGIVGAIVGAFMGALLLAACMGSFSQALLDVAAGNDPNAWIPGALILGGFGGAIIGAVLNIKEGWSKA